MPHVTHALLAPVLAAADHTWVSIAVAILGVGFLIFVHELGHFLACRATKTRVETFSIGFGPRLFGWETHRGVRRFTVGGRREPPAEGAMDVRISVVPLGGYVKMAGENPGERTEGATDQFWGKPFSARLLIITAGVIMNVLAAVGCLTVAYLLGVKEMPPVVGVVGGGSPAWRAGLRPGDRVVSVNGDPVRSFEELHEEIVFLASGEEATLEVERAGRRFSTTVRAEYDEEIGAPRIHVGHPSSWRWEDAQGVLEVGPEERVVVGGRFAVGGSMASSVAETLAQRGARTAKVELLDRPGVPPREIDLSSALVKPEKPVYRLGVVRRAPRSVRWVRPKSEAETAGLRPGDEIVSVDGASPDAREGLAAHASIGTLEVRRSGETLALPVRAATPEAVATFLFGVEFGGTSELVVEVDGTAIEGGKSPAAEAGIHSGDRILSIGDKPVHTWTDLLAAGRDFSAASVVVRVQTGAEPPRDVPVTPRPGLAKNPKLFQGDPPRSSVPVSGVFDALGLGATKTLREIQKVFRTIRSFIASDISADKNLGGPGTLVKISSQSLADGWGTFLVFLAIISANLAVLNILPIPVLDGGHLLFLVVEKVKGSPVRESTIAKAQLVGLVLLLALMAFAVRNDIKLWNR
jgi:regulator of sigma E protease